MDTNCLSMSDDVLCDICEEAMGKSTESKDEDEAVNEHEVEGESEAEGNEMDMKTYGSEMDIEEPGLEIWSESTIDGLEENTIVADQEKRWQVNTAMKIREMMSVFHKRCVLCWVNKRPAKHELSDCKEMPGKCSRCQSKGHSVRSCVPEGEKRKR